MTHLTRLNKLVRAAREAVEARGETFYPGPSRIHLAAFPPKERWNDWVELDSKAWPARVEKRYMLVPTTCFNCESACGLLAYVDRDTMQVRKFEGNPEHPGSRGRNCAKGPAKQNGAKLIVFDTRLSNTATHADHWVAPYPGSEAAILLAIANDVIQRGLYHREFVRRWWNWQEYLAHEHPGLAPSFETFEQILKTLYAGYTFEYAAAESGVDAGVLRELAGVVASAGTRLSTHTWRSAAAGNLGGWQVPRTLFFLTALLGAVATAGGTYPTAWNKFVPRPIYVPPHPPIWNELTWPREYPLAINELSFLLPHLLKDGRGRLDVYFTRVYNPVWTNPDGFSWIEALTDERLVGLHAALTPVWSETAFLADYVPPMGLGSARH